MSLHVDVDTHNNQQPDYTPEPGVPAPPLVDEHYLALALDAAENRGDAVFPLFYKAPALPKCPTVEEEGLSGEALARHAASCSGFGHGFHDASRDPARIHAMFNAALGRATGYGIAGGKASGKAFLDVDGSAAETEAVRRGYTSDYVVRSGRDGGHGWHLGYVLPEGVEVRKRSIAPGLELIGEGAYVVGPGSLHPSGRAYVLVRDGDPSELPPDLVTVDDGERPVRTTRSSSRYVDDGSPIPDGERNNTLTSIGGRRRAQGLERPEIEPELLAINEARCDPPLNPSEVRKIAASVSRYPAGAMPRVDAATLKSLDEIQREMWQTKWTSKSDLDLVKSLIKIGRRSGWLCRGGGVEVSISYRELAIEAAVSLRTVRKGLERLVESGWVRRGRRGAGTRAGTLMLLRRGKVPHSNHTGLVNDHREASVVPVRAPRLRHTAVLPVNVKGRRVDTIVIKRLGKVCGTIIDTLDTFGPSATVGEIGEVLQASRPRDLARQTDKWTGKEGPITRLEKRGIVRVDRTPERAEDYTVTLEENWLEALDEERTITGEKFQQKYWEKRYREQRRAYRERHKVKAHRFTMVDFARKLGRFTSDLEPATDARPDLVEALRDYLDRRPRRWTESPSWLAIALWSEEHIPYKPTPEAVEVALFEIRRSEADRGAAA